MEEKIKMLKFSKKKFAKNKQGFIYTVKINMLGKTQEVGSAMTKGDALNEAKTLLKQFAAKNGFKVVTNKTSVSNPTVKFVVKTMRQKNMI